MAYEKIGRGGCGATGLALIVIGLGIVIWITLQPSWMFTVQQNLAIMIATGIIALLCLIFGGVFLYTGIFYMPPVPRAPARACPQCGRILTNLPTDIKNCPYCGQKLE